MQLDHLTICLTRQSTAAARVAMRLSHSKVTDKAQSQVWIWDQREERRRVLGRDLGNRRTKKAGTDLGTDCVIKWSSR